MKSILFIYFEKFNFFYIVEFEKLIDQSNLIISKFALYFPTNSKNSFEQTLKKLNNKCLLLKSI